MARAHGQIRIVCRVLIARAELFALMKKQGMKVELLHEIAKDYVWERWDHIFREQDYILAHQHRLQRRLVGHDVNYVVIDSSILLGLFYTAPDMPPSFKVWLRDVFDSYDNINIYLQRSDAFPYVREGRNQDLEGAKGIDRDVLFYLEDNAIDHHVIVFGDFAASEALAVVKAHNRE